MYIQGDVSMLMCVAMKGPMKTWIRGTNTHVMYPGETHEFIHLATFHHTAWSAIGHWHICKWRIKMYPEEQIIPYFILVWFCSIFVTNSFMTVTPFQKKKSWLISISFSWLRFVDIMVILLWIQLLHPATFHLDFTHILSYFTPEAYTYKTIIFYHNMYTLCLPDLAKDATYNYLCEWCTCIHV